MKYVALQNGIFPVELASSLFFFLPPEKPQDRASPVRRDRGITYVEPYVSREPSVLALVPRSDEQESSGGTWLAS